MKIDQKANLCNTRITSFMVKFVKYNGTRYKITSYTYNGNQVNAEFYYYIDKSTKRWHEVKGIDLKKKLARKFPKKRKK